MNESVHVSSYIRLKNFETYPPQSMTVHLLASVQFPRYISSSLSLYPLLFDFFSLFLVGLVFSFGSMSRRAPSHSARFASVPKASMNHFLKSRDISTTCEKCFSFR